jgi:hypothetical protein
MLGQRMDGTEIQADVSSERGQCDGRFVQDPQAELASSAPLRRAR